jgi:hypothetical protein
MHCMVLSAPEGGDGWRIKRSVEVLAYHFEERRVSILFLLVGQSRKDENTLHLLHRGSVSCRLVPAWPLPYHKAETGSNLPSLLRAFYGPFFQGEVDNLSLCKELTCWDEALRLEKPEPIRASRGNEELGVSPPVQDHYVPFTVATVKVPHAGWHLLALEFSFQGRTFDRLLSRNVFTVDGPRRLLRRIQRDDMAALTPGERETWLAKLGDFTDPKRMLHCESYDVIVLTRPPADNVVSPADHCMTGISVAPSQPAARYGAVRYLTDDSLFTLPLIRAEAAADSAESYRKGKGSVA